MGGAFFHWVSGGLGIPVEDMFTIFGIFFLPIIAVVIIAWFIVRAWMKRRQWEHEEKMRMVERGIPPRTHLQDETPSPEKFSKREKVLLAGIILATLGLIILFPSFGFLLCLIGGGLITLYFLPLGKGAPAKGNRKFFLSGIIIGALGAGIWADSFGLFLLLLGIGLVGFYFLSQREMQPLASGPEEEKVEKKAEEAESEGQKDKDRQS